MCENDCKNASNIKQFLIAKKECNRCYMRSLGMESSERAIVQNLSSEAITPWFSLTFVQVCNNNLSFKNDLMIKFDVHASLQQSIV